MGDLASYRVEMFVRRRPRLKLKEEGKDSVPPLRPLHSFSNLLYGWSLSPIRPAHGREEGPLSEKLNTSIEFRV